MTNYEKRLLDEYWDLNDRINELEQSLDKVEFKEKIGEENFALLTKQCETMKSYLEILNKRIDNLGLYKRSDINDYNASSFINDRHSEYYIDRDKVIEKAYVDCMREMYAKAQPSASYDEYVRQYKTGEISDDDTDRVYDRHYLSSDEFEYILDKYIDAYGMTPKWHDNCDTIIKYFDDGALTDKWVPDEENPDIGNRSTENLGDFKDVITSIIENNKDTDTDKLSEEIKKAVINRIEECRDFYKFDREAGSFSMAVGLGASPTSNRKVVEKYWKLKGVDIQIEEHDPDTLWDKDYYGDDYDEDLPEDYDVIND